MPSSDLYAIVGLGNHGAEYGRTRHNAGFWFVDGLAAGAGVPFRTESKFHGELARISLGGRDVLLLKPGTFMNRSGQSVQALVQFYKLAPGSVLIAHDELDLSAGTMRLKAGGGHGGHNGLRDIHKVLGPDYLRLRIGIGHPGDKSLVLNYVLGRPGKNDETAILDGFDDAGRAIETWLTRGWERALMQLHTKPVPPTGGAS